VNNPSWFGVIVGGINLLNNYVEFGISTYGVYLWPCGYSAIHFYFYNVVTVETKSGKKDGR